MHRDQWFRNSSKHTAHGIEHTRCVKVVGFPIHVPIVWYVLIHVCKLHWYICKLIMKVHHYRLWPRYFICPYAVGYSGKILVWARFPHACHHIWHVGKGLVKNYGPNGRRYFVVMTAYAHGDVDRF